MLEVKNISKSFSGVQALKRISLELHPGKVNAIVGENGAGKSTLMKILSGVYDEYDGEILLNYKRVHFQNTKQAQEAGIAIIHQELNLIPNLSITENIFLGREIINQWGLLDRSAMREEAKKILNKLKFTTDPDSKVSALKVGQQQVVEMAKALLLDADIIIMDEPTSAISESEVDVLFEIINQLKKENKTIVYISHKLDELFKIADRYIVLRDGETIESGNREGMTFENLVQKMVGRDIKIAKKTAMEREKKVLFSVSNLSLEGKTSGQKILQDIQFELYGGEVLGIFGLMGAGRTELLEALFGLHAKKVNGAVFVNGKEVSLRSPADAINVGIALVPEDRKRDGLILDLDISTNLSLTNLNALQKFGWLIRAKETELVQKYTGELGIKAASPRQLSKTLSGGNQQKIVLAKWLATHPRILLLDEPTRGIDINAKNEIYKIILGLASEGMGIIMVSSELPEILSVSDRILVMNEGRISASFNREEATEQAILKSAIPKTI